MLLNLLYLLMVCGGGLASDELMDALGGVSGGNRMVLCLAPAPWEEPRAGGVCRGALWRMQWVLARASCLEGHSLSQVRVARDEGGLTCDDYQKGKNFAELASKVRVQFTHPAHRRSARAPRDLALLALDSDYCSSDVLANTSAVRDLLSELEPWMEDVYKQFPMGEHTVSYEHSLACFSSPLRMFTTTVLLPSATFMVLFLYVIHYTGPKEQIPYNSINYDSNTSIEEHKHDEEAKCEETDQHEAYDMFEQYGNIADYIFNSYGV